MTTPQNLSPPSRDSSEPEITDVRPEYNDSKNFPGIDIRNRPQLIPRPKSEFAASGYYDVLFSPGTSITDNFVIAKARENLILIDLKGESANAANTRADFNIFKPEERIYPRANGPLGPPTDYTLVDNYNVEANDLSNAGTNY
jgi:hypothetical protein